MVTQSITGTIYVLHFDRPYRHAKHYTGWTHSGGLDRRLAEHAAGRGARLLEFVRAAGIGWRHAFTVPGSRRRERRFKRHGGMTRYCPICTPTPRTPPGEPE